MTGLTMNANNMKFKTKDQVSKKGVLENLKERFINVCEKALDEYIEMHGEIYGYKYRR